MYLLELFYANSKQNGDGRFRFQKTRSSHTIPKWSFFSNDPAGRERLRLIAMGLGGEKYLNVLPLPTEIISDRRRPLRVLHVLARHYPLDSQNRSVSVLGSGVDVDVEGNVSPLRTKELSLISSIVPSRKLNILGRPSAYLLLAYGTGYRPGPRGEDFQFTDPLFRRTRFHSLLMQNAPLTNPVDFMDRLRYKAIRCGRKPSQNMLHALCEQLSRHLNINTDSWFDVDVDGDGLWHALRLRMQRALLPILDMARHMLDAFPTSATPMEMPGVVLMDQPESFCASGRFKDYVTLLDTLFPRLQFILSTATAAAESLPSSIPQKRLSLPEDENPPKKRGPVRLPKETILLIDVDGRLPNLALMKLSTHYRQKGYTVRLEKRDCFLEGPERVYASTVFYTPLSVRRNRRLRRHYGDKLTLGGTGEDISSSLPDAVEALHADYTLYPELGNRAIGFITRGCPFDCPFCVVPPKEGRPRQVSDLNTLLEGGRLKKLILLDDNILSHPNADRFLSEMAERKIMVNFTQTLDLRLVNRVRATLLKRIQCANTRFTRRNFHFSLNHNRHLDRVARKYRLFDFKPRDNVEFLCMYGFDTSLADDVERFKFLRSLPGAYIFTQKYLPIKGGPSSDIQDFFGPNPDPLIDQLVGLIFTQNMKSMENYYRWVSRRYAETYGKLHMGLVDTIFRYNQRHKKGEYIESLAGTKTRHS
ncbi:MAG: hypothetical protein K9N10_10345 [Deltaproteobacteria bacterium]|nr:hypothetical protein [Deltaproteobacteria bacterium]